MYHYTESGLDYIWLVNGYEEVNTSYGEGVGVHNVEGLHQSIGLHIVQNRPHLTGAEIRFLRTYLEMSQAELAKLLGVGDTSIRNWESGRGDIGNPADRLLRLLFVDHTCGDGTTRELVSRIADMNRDQYHEDLRFAEEDEQWSAAA